MKFFKENKFLVIGVFLVSIFFPIIILTPSQIGFIPYETGLTLVGYGGSIIGGFLTLYGVWWTIMEQKKELIEQQERLDNQRREDLAIQYKPFFVIKESNVQFIGNEVLHIRIVFENIGRGEANDVEIDYNLQNNKDEYFTISQPSNKKIIPSNGNCFLGITLQHPAGISIDNNVMNIDPLPIELNKVFKFSACLNYRNPIINEKQYFLEFDFNIVYAVKRDQHQKITSFKQGKDNLDREWIVQITNENYK